jgi:hypothetical protein
VVASRKVSKISAFEKSLKGYQFFFLIQELELGLGETRLSQDLLQVQVQ